MLLFEKLLIKLGTVRRSIHQFPVFLIAAVGMLFSAAIYRSANHFGLGHRTPFYAEEDSVCMWVLATFAGWLLILRKKQI